VDVGIEGGAIRPLMRHDDDNSPASHTPDPFERGGDMLHVLERVGRDDGVERVIGNRSSLHYRRTSGRCGG
jgi:hypothetical protein